MFSRLINLLQRRRRSYEVDSDETSAPLPAHNRSPSPVRVTKFKLATRGQAHSTHIEEPIPWKMSTTVVHQQGQSSKLSKHDSFHNKSKEISKSSKQNPFHNKSKETRPTVVNDSSTLPRGKLFHSDWNLNHLKEKRRKSESLLPFKIDSKGKPLVPVALGSRQRMSSRS